MPRQKLTPLTRSPSSPSGGKSLHSTYDTLLYSFFLSIASVHLWHTKVPMTYPCAAVTPLTSSMASEICTVQYSTVHYSTILYSIGKYTTCQWGGTLTVVCITDVGRQQTADTPIIIPLSLVGPLCGRYNYVSNTCTPGATCRDWLQMVYAGTTKFGCGQVRFCSLTPRSLSKCSCSGALKRSFDLPLLVAPQRWTGC